MSPPPTPSQKAPTDERQLEPTTAETAECTCPDFCERDHELD